MLNLPFWLHNILFFQRGFTWDIVFYGFRTYGQVMHRSPIDSSFTYLRIHIGTSKCSWYPITCTAGYQPNAGMQLSLFHRQIFDFTKWAQKRVYKREGWEWKDK